MKKLSKTLILLFILLLIIGSIFFYFAGSSDLDTFRGEDKPISLEEKLLESDINIYGTSSVPIYENEINFLLKKELEVKLKPLNSRSLLKYEGIYTTLQKEGLWVHTELKLAFIPLRLDLKIIPMIYNNKLGFKIDSIRLGRVGLPLSLLNWTRLNLKNNTYFIGNFSTLEGFTLEKIVTYENKIEIYFSTQYEILIKKYVKEKDQVSVREMIEILSHTKTNRSFANTLIKTYLIKAKGDTINADLQQELVEKFNALTPATKTNLFFTMLKYGIGETLNFLKEYLKSP